MSEIANKILSRLEEFALDLECRSNKFRKFMCSHMSKEDLDAYLLENGWKQLFSNKGQEIWCLPNRDTGLTYYFSDAVFRQLELDGYEV